MQRQLALVRPYGSAPRGHPLRHAVREVAREARRHREDSDLKLFVLSFTAFFVCFYTFIA